jgi:hypothetical protein
VCATHTPGEIGRATSGHAGASNNTAPLGQDDRNGTDGPALRRRATVVRPEGKGGSRQTPKDTPISPGAGRRCARSVARLSHKPNHLYEFDNGRFCRPRESGSGRSGFFATQMIHPKIVTWWQPTKSRAQRWFVRQPRDVGGVRIRLCDALAGRVRSPASERRGPRSVATGTGLSTARQGLLVLAKPASAERVEMPANKD